MLLRKIYLESFRNFEKINFELNPFLTIIFGKNSKGKTNLLEAIYFAINGVGFREKRELELINFHKKTAKIRTVFFNEKDSQEFSIYLKNDDNYTNKIFFINKTKKKYPLYKKETTYTVLFDPQQIKIITDSPNLRRDYFNKLISFFNIEYKKKLTNYKNALRKRNRLLKIIRNKASLEKELVFWNRYLEKQGEYVTRIRQLYIDFLNQHSSLDGKIFKIEYSKNLFTFQKASSLLDREIKMQKTLIGPQKDDFKIYLENKNINVFGSRSEQRLAVFWLKVNEINYYQEILKKNPIILLDDLLSELDIVNKKLVLKLTKKYQTVITTSNPLSVDLIDTPKSIIRL